MAGAGAKSELVTVERYTRSADGGGGAAVAWASIGQLWAEVKWIGGGESERQGAVRALAKYRFTVWQAGADELALTTEDRVVWNGEAYNIRERPRRLARTPETEIIAETGVAQ